MCTTSYYTELKFWMWFCATLIRDFPAAQKLRFPGVTSLQLVRNGINIKLLTIQVLKVQRQLTTAVASCISCYPCSLGEWRRSSTRFQPLVNDTPDQQLLLTKQSDGTPRKYIVLPKRDMNQIILVKINILIFSFLCNVYF